ncbi:MAG: hypothetical protein QXJ93_02345 [Candidatus Rehaiarchaeum fermentans]|nr:hypothetical protein [Candidatus Rehaiarchaeum fermentans]
MSKESRLNKLLNKLDSSSTFNIKSIPKLSSNQREGELNRKELKFEISKYGDPFYIETTVNFFNYDKNGNYFVTISASYQDKLKKVTATVNFYYNKYTGNFSRPTSIKYILNDNYILSSLSDLPLNLLENSKELKKLENSLRAAILHSFKRLQESLLSFNNL